VIGSIVTTEQGVVFVSIVSNTRQLYRLVCMIVSHAFPQQLSLSYGYDDDPVS